MSEPGTPKSERLLRVDEVAALLSVSRWFVYDHGDELGLVKIGGSNRYIRERVEAYIARSASEPEVPRRNNVRTLTPRPGSRRVPLLEPGR